MNGKIAKRESENIVRDSCNDYKKWGNRSLKILPCVTLMSQILFHSQVIGIYWSSLDLSSGRLIYSQSASCLSDRAIIRFNLQINWRTQREIMKNYESITRACKARKCAISGQYRQCELDKADEYYQVLTWSIWIEWDQHFIRFQKYTLIVNNIKRSKWE